MLAAHQFMGMLNEFTLWPWMMGRRALTVPVEELVGATLRMFLQHYGRQRGGGKGSPRH
jgi:TetR/AcrR family transcriptional regulator, regulator of autoinduction and epiphytic fitness